MLDHDLLHPLCNVAHRLYVLGLLSPPGRRYDDIAPAP
jgi:hypothetical protein